MELQVIKGAITESRKEQIIASAKAFWQAYSSMESYTEWVKSPYGCCVDWKMEGGKWRRLRASEEFWIEGEEGEHSPRLVKVWAS